VTEESACSLCGAQRTWESSRGVDLEVARLAELTDERGRVCGLGKRP
jgi:hypothetical protein